MSLWSHLDFVGWVVDAFAFMASPWVLLGDLVGALVILLIGVIPFLGILRSYSAAVALLIMVTAWGNGMETAALWSRHGAQEAVKKAKEQDAKNLEKIKAQAAAAEAALAEERTRRAEAEKAATASRQRLREQASKPGQDAPMAPVLADVVKSIGGAP